MDPPPHGMQNTNFLKAYEDLHVVPTRRNARKIERRLAWGVANGPINRKWNKLACKKNQNARKMNRLLIGWATVSVGGDDGPLN